MKVVESEMERRSSDMELFSRCLNYFELVLEGFGSSFKGLRVQTWESATIATEKCRFHAISKATAATSCREALLLGFPEPLRHGPVHLTTGQFHRTLLLFLVPRPSPRPKPSQSPAVCLRSDRFQWRNASEKSRFDVGFDWPCLVFQGLDDVIPHLEDRLDLHLVQFQAHAQLTSQDQRLPERIQAYLRALGLLQSLYHHVCCAEILPI